MKGSVTKYSTVVASSGQVASDLGGEVAILGLKSDKYYGLDAVGARIWELIQRPRLVSEIRDTLVAEYEVEPDRCEVDLLALLQTLSDEGLIEVRDEPPA